MQKERLDRPELREQVAQIIYETTDTSFSLRWGKLHPQVREQYRIRADQVLALIEEGRKSERGRVVAFLKQQGAVWVDKNFSVIKAIEQDRMVAFDLSAIDSKVKGRGV